MRDYYIDEVAEVFRAYYELRGGADGGSMPEGKEEVAAEGFFGV